MDQHQPEPTVTSGNAPLVSVVMPVYRPEPRYLRAAIQSILDQTFSDLELIIVEDPSEQSGRAIVESFDDARIRYILNPTRTSLVQQHNAGMHRVRGAFVCRFDADDISMPTRIERELQFLREHPECDVVGTFLTVIDENDHVVGQRRYPTENHEIVAAMRRYNPVANSSVMFRRELLTRFGDRRDEVVAAEDYDWYSRLGAGGARFATIPECLIRYRLHGGSMKSTKLKQTLRHTVAVKKTFWRSSMSFGDRIMMLVEQALLVVPDALVLFAFRKLRYRASDPATDASTSSHR